MDTKIGSAKSSMGTTGGWGVVALTAGMMLSGCKAKPAVTDDALASTIQTQLAQDGALAGQQVQVGVQNGVATLSGTVGNDAQRTIAARDAAGVQGVKQVQNGLTVSSMGSVATTIAPGAAPLQAAPATQTPGGRRDRDGRDGYGRDQRDQRGAAPVERVAPGGGYNGNGTVAQGPGGPPAAPQAQAPAFRDVTIPAGDSLPVRVTQTLDSATTQQGDTFSGVVASDIVVDGAVAVAAGTNVSGQVDAVHEAGHFKGSSLLTVSLSSLNRRGERVAVSTEPYTVAGRGRGKNTAEKAGGGAAVGALLGGIFGGGKGAAIGAAAGGGAGAGVNAVTRGQQVQIASETVVRFRLSAPVTVRVRSGDGEGRQPLR